MIPVRPINPGRTELEKGRRAEGKKENRKGGLRFPRDEAGQQKHSARINFYSGRFSRQPFDNLQVLPHKGGPERDGGGRRDSGRQVPRGNRCPLSLSHALPLSLPLFPVAGSLSRSPLSGPFLSNQGERKRDVDEERRGGEDRVLLRRTLALATGAPAIYFPGFQSPKPLISAPQRQWSASGRRRGAWRRRRRSALSRRASCIHRRRGSLLWRPESRQDEGAE